TSTLNFNPAWYFGATSKAIDIPLSGFAPERQTLFSVYQARDAATEKSIWRYAIEGKTQNLLTTHRLADLRKLEYMNFPRSANGFPTINTYLQQEGEAEQANSEIMLTLAAPPEDHQLPISAFQG